MTIDTREELIYALNEASEIEHGLLVQYLYTILTMKRRTDEGLSTLQQKLTREWQSTMLRVAREEMVHLGIVSNLLVAVGARPHFSRPNVPQKTGYYPFPFDLLPFSDEALHRFLVFENPRNYPQPPPPGADLSSQTSAKSLKTMAAVAPEPLEYQYVGELYAQISAAFETLPEKSLFIGPQGVQSEWGIDETPDSEVPPEAPGKSIPIISTREHAKKAILQIIEQGEGNENTREGSHYDRFYDIRQRFFELKRFPAARAVPVNPVTRLFPDAGGTTTLIKNPLSRDAAETFGVIYGSMLMMLDMSFQIAPLNEAETRRKSILQDSVGQIMTVAIRPLGEILSELPLDDADAPARAGPTFEIYGDSTASPFVESRWEILFERLDAAVLACKALGKEIPRAVLLAETLGYLFDNLRLTRKGAG